MRTVPYINSSRLALSVSTLPVSHRLHPRYINTPDMHHEHDLFRGRPAHRPVRMPQPPRHHVPNHHHGARHVPRVLQASRTILISSDRLKRWRAELDALEELRAAIKTLSMYQSEKVKLFALTTQVKSIVGSVQNEIREKLKT